ncbi:MAG: hypothetical protein JXR63_00900 [Spirochaetales bacterium]|nr:hypothetical protein [Spirochaetales bacterium]
MAQTGSFHARILTKFERQSFFLQVKELRLPARIHGRCTAKARLIESSETSFKYEVKISRHCYGIFFFSTLKYENFNEAEQLSDFYKGQVKKIWKKF